MNDSGILISGGSLIISLIAMLLAVVSNLRGHSLHQRQLDVERRMDRLEGVASHQRDGG
jgi:hypothetical protein